MSVQIAGLKTGENEASFDFAVPVCIAMIYLARLVHEYYHHDDQ